MFLMFFFPPYPDPTHNILHDILVRSVLLLLWVEKVYGDVYAFLGRFVDGAAAGRPGISMRGETSAPKRF